MVLKLPLLVQAWKQNQDNYFVADKIFYLQISWLLVLAEFEWDTGESEQGKLAKATK